jgi:signal transduction histidine kinase/ActR/RegA family two-component response regulator
MLLVKARLIEFIEPVPTVSEDGSLESVWEAFGNSKSDRLVVIDNRKQPLGAIDLSGFLPNLEFMHSKVSGLQNLTAKSSITEPLEVLPAGFYLKNFLQHLSLLNNSNYRQQYALVNETGEYLGLLDTGLLLRYLAQHQIEEDKPVSDRVGETHLEFLIQLLEHFPLPVTILTEVGEAIAQNQSWQTQISQVPAISEIHTLDKFNLFSNEENLNKNELEEASHPNKIPEPYWQFLKIPLPRDLLTETGTSKAKDIITPDNLFWLVVAVDVTIQKQVAWELAAKNADLVQLNRLKDEFLACVSHELKTPLTTVLGLSTLLKAGKVGELNERQSRYVGLIDKSGRQLMTVVNDILDLTRLETSQVELELAPLPIARVCDRAYQQALELYLVKQPPVDTESPQLKFSLDIEPELQDIVADEQRLCQMLVHLLSNAFKFTKSGGDIGLKVSHRQGWIAFTVWDTGIGIPEEKQHLLFQKFQQLESPLTREFEGIGLGLVLTQRLARLHGGDLSFVSKSGQGSQFTLLLPPSPPRDWRFSLVEEGVEDRSKLTESGELAHKLKLLTPHPLVSTHLVLVVETVPRYIEDLTEKLGSLGYWVLVARSGTEAIQKARQFQPAAILLNPLLPILSGWDVLTILKADEKTRHIPVTITATVTDKEINWQSQAQDFLTLPVETSHLQQVLMRLTRLTGDRDRSLTILYLTVPYQLESLESHVDELFASATEPLYALVSQLNYRVVEADDLEQADFLARLWQPDVIVFDAVGIAEPVVYLQQLTHSLYLANLPIVAVGETAIQAGKQIPTLSVFPCLSSTSDRTTASVRPTSNLLQVIQVAAGLVWEHSILVVDVESIANPIAAKVQHGDRIVHSDWLLAATQYLHTAGLKTVFSHGWSEVKTQIAAHYFDLLLIYWESVPSDPQVTEELLALTKIGDRPPILCLNRTDKSSSKIFSALTHPSDGAKPSDSIVHGDSYSMADLVRSIDQAISTKS